MTCGALVPIVGTRQTASPISIHEGADYREEGVARLVLALQPPVRPLVPLPRRPARSYETFLVTGSDAG